MKYVVTGSLGNISQPLTRSLVKGGHEVTVITSKTSNTAAIETLGAKAAVGSVEDVAFLTQIFSGADAVYTMIPPNFAATDWKQWIAQIGSNYAAAIQAAGVKKVVNLSSVGAHMPDGAGPVSGLYFAEKALNAVPGTDIRHLRPGYFYQNFLSNIGMIKQMGFMGGNFGSDAVPFPIVSTNDIAAAAAEELLQLSFTGHSVRYIASEEITGSTAAKILGTAIGKPELQWVVFTDEQFLQGALQAGLPEEIARNFTEMGHALHTGEMNAEYFTNQPQLSPTKLADFATVFAAAYNA